MEKGRNFTYCMPRKTRIGIDAVHYIGSDLSERNIKKCLLVTDDFMAKSAIAQKISDLLAASGVQIFIYSGVKPNPTLSQVNEGVKEFLDKQCSAVISMGGGSPHDCAKAIKLSVLKGKLTNLNQIPLVAINTTAGTASELTRFAIITDEEAHYKLSIIDEDIIPDIAVDDPVLTKEMPKSLTAATGMDALVHALEAYVARDRNPITDCTAVKAVELVRKHLAKAYQKGDDMEAREGMIYAQYLAGMAFSNAGLGLVHAMAHQLGGLYNLPHGVCNAVLLPYVVKFNMKGGTSGYGVIAKAAGICPAGLPDSLAAQSLIRYIKELSSQLNIPKSLKELKVSYEDCDQLAEMAMRDPSLKANPVEASKHQVKEIYQGAYNGELWNASFRR